MFVIAGYSEALSRDWAMVSLILKISMKGVDLYINLHSHILDVSTDNPGDWEVPLLNLSSIMASFCFQTMLE